jgi:hypothetical protein
MDYPVLVTWAEYLSGLVFVESYNQNIVKVNAGLSYYCSRNVPTWDNLYLANTSSPPCDFWFILFPLFLVLICGVVFLYALISYADYYTPVGNNIVSAYISVCAKLIRQPTPVACNLRNQFRCMPNTVVRNSVNHSHPSSAQSRSGSALFMDLFCKLVAKPGYFIQRSIADLRSARSGCRTYYWGKDLNSPFAPYNKPSDGINCLVDTDMYLDMPKFLSHIPDNYIISTFQPTSVCATLPEYNFTFNQDNEVVYTVNGGAVYKHPVWNYASDILTVERFRWRYLSFELTSYNVDRRQIGPHHQLILLTPLQRLRSPFISLIKVLGGSPLTRLEPVTGDFLRLAVNESGGQIISTGRVNQLIVANIPAALDHTLNEVSSLGKTDLTVAQVKTIIADECPTKSAVLTAFHRMHSPASPPVVFPMEESVHNYQFTPRTFDPDAKPVLKPFMSPIINGNCYAPCSTKANEAAAVKGRLTSIRCPSDLPFQSFMSKFMDEFVDFLIPSSVKGKLHPVDHDMVFENQNRPSQRVILDQACNLSVSAEVKPLKTFIKAEAYQACNDPRIITTFPGVQKYGYSKFIYALAVLTTDWKWYCFGKSNLDVANRVALICETSDVVLSTDFSRMDGRISHILRTLELQILLTAFHTSYKDELTKLYATQHSQRAFTRLGVKYDQGDARGSGGPDTAMMNTIVNAFLAYCTLRRTNLINSVHSPLEAWDALGIYGGDDGLTADVQPKVYIDMCLSFGQVLEVEEYPRGSSGVNFLSREYGPYVWHGDNNSMCDVRRQLSKLHVTASLPANITPLRKLGEKCKAFYLSDKNTPIIGHLCVYFVTNFPGHVPGKLGEKEMRGVAYYHASEDGEQYPNSDSGWMMDAFLAKNKNFDVNRFFTWLDGVGKDETKILSPVCCEFVDEIINKSTEPAVIGGDIVPGKQEKVATKKICDEFKNKGSCKFGLKCKYEHINNAKACPFFPLGKCNYGGSCKFKH